LSIPRWIIAGWACSTNVRCAVGDAAHALDARIREREPRLKRRVRDLHTEHRVAEIAGNASDVESRAFVAQTAQLRRAAGCLIVHCRVESCAAVRDSIGVDSEHVADAQPRSFVGQPHERHLRRHLPRPAVRSGYRLRHSQHGLLFVLLVADDRGEISFELPHVGAGAPQ
jgi:hypothetical protein